MEKQIIQLETLSAMQDETIASLNREIFRQQQDLTMLGKRLARLEEKLEKMQGSAEMTFEERPPHYWFTHYELAPPS